MRTLAVAALVVGAGCGDKATTEEQPLTSTGGGCVGNIDVHVSFAPTGKMPSFDWTPHCGISSLTVQTVPFMGAAPVLAWALSAPELNPVKPVIEYGVLPRGAKLSSGPANLAQGITYRITVDQTVGLDAVVAHGERTFTIP